VVERAARLTAISGVICRSPFASVVPVRTRHRDTHAHDLNYVGASYRQKCFDGRDLGKEFRICARPCQENLIRPQR